jgi:hypothetical protein
MKQSYLLYNNDKMHIPWKICIFFLILISVSDNGICFYNFVFGFEYWYLVFKISILILITVIDFIRFWFRFWILLLIFFVFDFGFEYCYWFFSFLISVLNTVIDFVLYIDLVFNSIQKRYKIPVSSPDLLSIYNLCMVYGITMFHRCLTKLFLMRLHGFRTNNIRRNFRKYIYKL